MPNFNQLLMNQAYAIMNTKGTIDDVQAVVDVQQAENMLSTISTYGINYPGVRANAQALNRHLRNKYPEIEALQKCVDALPRIPIQQNSNVILPAEVYLLRADICGICASVLIKHNKVGLLEDTLINDAEPTGE
jgi:hypothetical protein